MDSEELSLQQAVDFLYDIRCDVVHRGQYYTIFFPKGREKSTIVLDKEKKEVQVSITLKELRLIMLRASRNACFQLVNNSTY